METELEHRIRRLVWIVSILAGLAGWRVVVNSGGSGSIWAAALGFVVGAISWVAVWGIFFLMRWIFLRLCSDTKE